MTALLWFSASCAQSASSAPRPLLTASPLPQKTSPTVAGNATDFPPPTACPTQTPASAQAIYLSGSSGECSCSKEKEPYPTAPNAASPTAITDTPPPEIVVSPLQGIALDELTTILSQPYLPPPPGEDTGHHGTDFAYWRRGNEGAILGKPVLAALGGRIAAVMANRPPFGYAILIETPLKTLPNAWIAKLTLPPLPSPLPTISRLSCSLTNTQELIATSEESIYTLYAHLNLTPTLQIGEIISLGAQIGEVGNSGYSSAPHLHLEMRVGPANYAPGSLAFYEVATTDSERYHYCLWRISGVFRSFDPLTLLNTKTDDQ